MTNGIPPDIVLLRFLFQLPENLALSIPFTLKPLGILLCGTMISYPQDVFQNHFFMNKSFLSLMPGCK